ncbi:MAG: chloride channel protein [Phycisphaerales bacterium]|nr:chloride channel protein [Phycisphaerales bacterium]
MRPSLTRVLRKTSLRLGFERDWYLYLVAAAIGIVIAGVATLFIAPLRHVEMWGIEMQGSPNLWWIVLCAPCIGGLIVGILRAIIRAEDVGPGITTLMYAVLRKRSRIRWRMGLQKWMGSTATIASGGSAGAEGPIITIGGVIGSNIARLLGTRSQNTATLLGCGSAAGIAAVFNAPIAGVLFVMEILLRDFSLKTFTPIVIAAVVASAATQGILHDSALFDVGDGFMTSDEFFSIQQLPLYLGLGLLCGLTAVLFIRTLDLSGSLFGRIPVSPLLKPAVGGLILGLLGVLWIWMSDSSNVPSFYGNGYPVITALISPEYYFQEGSTTELNPIGQLALVLAALFLLKLVGTCLTLGSGGAGGMFAPSLLLGAALGGTFGVALEWMGWLPHGQPAHFALVGMAAMLAGTTHAPLTAILIVYELTQSYQVMMPLMFAAVIATIVSRSINRNSIYTSRLRQLGIRMGLMSDLTILRRMTVSNVALREPVLVRENDPAQTLLDVSESRNVSNFIVLNDHGNYAGMVTAEGLKTALLHPEAIPLLQVNELERCNLPTCTTDECLDTVLEKFSRNDVEALPVFSADDVEHPVGVITRSRLMQVYQAELDRDQ